MEHLSFVLWILGWAFLYEYIDHISFKKNKKLNKTPDKKEEDGAFIIWFLFWVVIGILVY